MRIKQEFLTIPGENVSIRCSLMSPVGGEKLPALLFYSDIFQLTPSTLRMVARFAGYGFAVFAPEIYARRVPAGTAWAFDDEGRVQGQSAAKATTTAEFDADRDSVLAAMATHPQVDAARISAVGFCLGGHLAFRAALSPQVKSTVAYYPTGLHNNELGQDAATSLEEAHQISGLLHLVFGLQDPHVPQAGRELIERELKSKHLRLTLSDYPAEHAFMRDEGPRFDPEITDQAFAAGIATLRSI